MSDTPAMAIDDCWHRIGVWGRETPRCPKLEEHLHCRNCEVYHAAGQQLHNRPLPPDYQEEWTRIIAREKVAREIDGQAALVFRLGKEWLALPATLVEEIVEERPVHRLPHRASPVLKGVVNIRGKLRLCLSLTALLGIEAVAPADADAHRLTYPRLLVLRADPHPLVVTADEVRGTHRYRPEQLEELPATLSGALTRFSTGALTVDEDNVGVLDPELLLYALGKELG